MAASGYQCDMTEHRVGKRRPQLWASGNPILLTIALAWNHDQAGVVENRIKIELLKECIVLDCALLFKVTIGLSVIVFI